MYLADVPEIISAIARSIPAITLTRGLRFTHADKAIVTAPHGSQVYDLEFTP